ncbi:hypothetical protein HDU98_005879 [Podochytrium sp. JEL0797]|nr:hypothetical protein HDU98_005879 [Podochytrium sp. JEL0797]
MSRIATLLRKETTHVDEELAHEHATMNFLSRIHPSLLDLKEPVSPTAQPKTPHLALTVDEALLDPDSVPALPRTLPIPISHVKDPASYASHTSKLNPENNYLMYRQPYENASPIMSPSTQTAMLLSPGVGNKNKRKLSIDSEGGRYDLSFYHNPTSKRRTNSTSISTAIATSSPNTSMYLSPQTQPMSLPTSPSWRTTPHQQPFGSANNPHPAATTPTQGMTGVVSVAGQPLLPGPVMGLMNVYMGSPMMRRSTSASSTGSQMAGVVSGGGGVSIFGGASGGATQAMPPGSPRVGVVFGGGANVVVASPRGGGGGGVVGTPTSLVANQFGQLLNMGGAQDHLSKMSLS